MEPQTSQTPLPSSSNPEAVQGRGSRRGGGPQASSKSVGAKRPLEFGDSPRPRPHGIQPFCAAHSGDLAEERNTLETQETLRGPVRHLPHFPFPPGRVASILGELGEAPNCSRSGLSRGDEGFRRARGCSSTEEGQKLRQGRRSCQDSPWPHSRCAKHQARTPQIQRTRACGVFGCSNSLGLRDAGQV